MGTVYGKMQLQKEAARSKQENLQKDHKIETEG